jgi:hypothetical protein
MAEDRDSPERPRVEPEIIPPGQSPRRPAWRAHDLPDIGGTHRIYVTRLGPFGGVLLLLAIAILAAVILLVFLGALLIWIPVIALVVIVAALSGIFGLRRW